MSLTSRDIKGLEDFHDTLITLEYHSFNSKTHHSFTFDNWVKGFEFLGNTRVTPVNTKNIHVE